MGTATVESPTPTPAMMRETNICLYAMSVFASLNFEMLIYEPILETSRLYSSPNDHNEIGEDNGTLAPYLLSIDESDDSP